MGEFLIFWGELEMSWRFLGEKKTLKVFLNLFSFYFIIKWFFFYFFKIKNGSFLFFYGLCMWRDAHKKLKSHLRVKHKNLGLHPKGNYGWNRTNNGMNKRFEYYIEIKYPIKLIWLRIWYKRTFLDTKDSW